MSRKLNLKGGKAIVFVDMGGRQHAAKTSDVITGPDVDRIDLRYTFHGFEMCEFDVPKKTPKSKRHYWK